MITVLLRLFHLMNRWSSDHRPDPWMQRASHLDERYLDERYLDERYTDERYTDERYTDESTTWTEEPPRHDAVVHNASAGRRRRLTSPVPYLRALRSDIGMTTAEYAVGTVAAVAFAVVLFKVVQSPAVHSALAAVVVGALNVHL